MADLGVESLRWNLLDGNPIVTIAYMKGLGIFKERHEVTHMVDKAKQQEKFKNQMEKTLGLEMKKQLEEIGVDTEKVKDEQSPSM